MRGDEPLAINTIVYFDDMTPERGPTYVMPGTTDLYFPPEDSQNEVDHMPNATFVPITSIWGHFAGGPGLNQADVTFLDEKLKELLKS